MSSTKLNPAELRRIANKFDEERQRIQDQLAIIEREVEATRWAWTGRAGLGYQNVSQMWGEEQKSLLRLLEEVAQLARIHASESEAATDQAAGLMRLPL